MDDWASLPVDERTPIWASVYDATGNATTITDPSGTSTFTYDATNRIETIVGPSGITTFTYDDSGQLLTRQAPLGATTTYTWDGDGRLIKAELPGSAVFTLIYDGQGMLGSKQSASGTTQYLWQGKVLQAQTDGTGNPIKVYTQGQGQHGDLSASYDVAGDTTSYPLTDAQGTAIGIVDDSGSVTRTNVFDAFGKQTDSTGSGEESLRYVASKGYLWHHDLGLYYVRQRWFDPSFQKWLSNDPLVFGGGDYNLNRYVKNRAMDMEDPSGEFVFLLILAGLAIAAAGVGAVHHGVSKMESSYQNEIHLNNFGLHDPNYLSGQNWVTGGVTTVGIGVSVALSPLMLSAAAFFTGTTVAAAGFGTTALAFGSEGLITGALTSGLTAYGKGESAGEIAEEAAIGGGTGLVLGVATAGIGSGLRFAFRKAPISDVLRSARRFLRVVKPGGEVDESLLESYTSAASSPKFAQVLKRYNAWVERYNVVAKWVKLQPLAKAATAEEVEGALPSQVTLRGRSNFLSALFPEGEHPGVTPFWLQGNPEGLYGESVARHELLHLAAAMRGQKNIILHEILVQHITTPHIFYPVAGGLGSGLIYGLYKVKQAL